MALEFRRVDPFEMRERILEFFWRIRIWPYPTKEHYFRYWDWRARAVSEGAPAVWLACDGATVVGHVAVNFRNLALKGHRLRAGIPAHLRMDAAYSGALGAALCNAPRALVRNGEIDLLMSYANPVAHRMAVASGSRELGPMQFFVKVLLWAPLLRRRAAAFAPFAPVADGAMRVWRLLRGSRNPERLAYLTAKPVTAEEVAGMSRTHWGLSGALNWDGSLEYFVGRFSLPEFHSDRVMAVSDLRTGRLEGLVAIQGESKRLSILQCAVNESAISPIQAIESVIAVHPDVETVRVALLPNSDLAREFAGAGYLPLSARWTEEAIRDTCWSAYWLREHPLAKALAQTHHWNLWYGWCHH
ncbi:MAG: hypothetical protein ACREV7_17040 [Steroidobacteraceae bacterium]